LSLLELLAESESMTLIQLAQGLATSKTSAFRLASSLLDRGWLAKNDDLRYRSACCPRGPGAQSDHGEELKVVLRPILGDLHEETR
jgi:DNA-binding IclR family transcriptional regulator